MKSESYIKKLEKQNRDLRVKVKELEKQVDSFTTVSNVKNDVSSWSTVDWSKKIVSRVGGSNFNNDNFYTIKGDETITSLKSKNDFSVDITEFNKTIKRISNVINFLDPKKLLNKVQYNIYRSYIWLYYSRLL